MIEIGLFGIMLALLWIGWELHRIIKRADEFMEGYAKVFLKTMYMRTDDFAKGFQKGWEETGNLPPDDE